METNYFMAPASGADFSCKIGKGHRRHYTKMLLEQLKELMDSGFVEKQSFEGYPLHVEYSLTESQGRELLKALVVMQHIGIEYLKAEGKENLLIEKGVIG